jgi:hypothetical protein
MNEAQFYRAKAQHCERLAANTFDGEVKKKLIALSRWWRERATEEESTPPVFASVRCMSHALQHRGPSGRYEISRRRGIRPYVRRAP